MGERKILPMSKTLSLVPLLWSYNLAILLKVFFTRLNRNRSHYSFLLKKSQSQLWSKIAKKIKKTKIKSLVWLFCWKLPRKPKLSLISWLYSNFFLFWCLWNIKNNRHQKPNVLILGFECIWTWTKSVFSSILRLVTKIHQNHAKLFFYNTCGSLLSTISSAPLLYVKEKKTYCY